MNRSATVLLLSALAATPATASVVTLDLKVNGSAAPTTVMVGDTVTVQIFGTVTDNTSMSVALGIAGYASDILSTGGYLQPVRASDGFGGYTQNWEAIYDSRFGITAPGNALNAGHLDDVMGHGATVGVIGLSNRNIGVMPLTLLATGYFTAVAPGITTLQIDNPSALVITYDGAYHSVNPTTLIANSGIDITVVPVPEPASLAILGFAAAGLLGRARRRPR